MALAKRKEGTALFTLTQKKRFVVEVDGTSLTITPESGTSRRVSLGQVENFCQAFAERQSFRRDAYPETHHGSYLVALAREFQRCC